MCETHDNSHPPGPRLCLGFARGNAPADRTDLACPAAWLACGCLVFADVDPALSMPSKILPIPEWLPDQPQFANPGTSRVVNVIPITQQSYGPVRGPVPYSAASPLPDPPIRGSYSF